MGKTNKTTYEINKEFISNMDDKLFLQEYTTIMKQCSDSPDIHKFVENSTNEQHTHVASFKFTESNQTEE